MAWTAISADEVAGRLTGTEQDLVKRRALAADQGDPTNEVLSGVIEEARGYIAARPRANTQLGPAGTIPPQAREAVIAMARWRLLGRLAVGTAGSLMQSEPRRKEYEDAIKYLQDVAKGLIVVEEPPRAGPEILPDTTPGSGWGGLQKEDF